MKNFSFKKETMPLREFSTHICSDGNKTKSLFSTIENSVRVMNLIPVTCYMYSCRILCHEIMLTHFHLIIQGSPENCEKVRCQLSLIQKSEESELRKEANDYAKNLYQRKNVSKASFNERMSIARKLWEDRRTYSLSILSRVTFIDKNVLQATFGKEAECSD